MEAEGDWALAALAAAQRGVAHVEQLLDCGLSHRAIRYRRERGRLHPVFPSVLAIGSPALPPLGLETAALLHAGDDTLLSDRTGAALWGMVEARPGDPVQLTAIGRRCADRPGLRVRRVAAIDLSDVRLHRGLPVTAPERTLIDLAATATPAETAEALNEARMRRLVTDGGLDAAIARCPQRPGIRQLREVREAELGTGWTQLELERRFRALVAAADLPAPQFNASLLGYRVDVLWPGERVVVELDGIGSHGRPRAFHADRRRDQRLAAAGYVVLRVTAPQLRHEPVAVIVRVAQALTISAAQTSRAATRDRP